MTRQRRKLQTLIIGILKDKASLVKAIVLASSERVAVLRATTHDPTSPPADHHVNAILVRGGHGTRRASSACIKALMDRLGGTRSAPVALKCIIVAHSILSRGSFILHDQLSFFPNSGGRNSLNLSTFRDHSDNEAWELSEWVRWYARVVEQNLMVSRVLGYYLHHSGSDKEENSKISTLPSSELLGELDALVDYVERTREAPESFGELQKNVLVYEVLRLVGEDYKLVQREIVKRVKELGDRVSYLSSGELTRLINGLKRLEDCNEKLVSMFLKRKRDDDFWGVICDLKINVAGIMIEKRVSSDGNQILNNENSTRFFNNPFVEPGRLFLLSSPNGLTVSVR